MKRSVAAGPDPESGKEASTDRSGWIFPLTLALFGLALIIRVWRYLASHLARDAAMGGINSIYILEGDFPLFFLGQNFMGALDSYLSAPIFLLFGPSTLTANFLPTLLSWGTLWVTYLTLKRTLGPTGWLLGLWYLAIPTAIGLFCITEGKAIYLLPLFFCALLMWITLDLTKTDRPVRAPLALAWGLVAGLAFWTNFLSAAVIAACAVFWIGRLPWVSRLKTLGWAVGGAVLGTLPLAVFFFSGGSPWLGLVKPGETYTLTDRLSALFFNALPIALGINPADNETGLAPGSIFFFVYLLLLALLVWAGCGLLRRGIQTSRKELLLPVLVLVFMMAAVLWGGRPNDYRGQDQRYLLPLYLALPFLWGFWGQRLRRQTLTLVLLGILLAGVHLSGYGTFKGRAPLLAIRYGHAFGLEGRLRDMTRSWREAGLHHIYHEHGAASNFVLMFLAGGDPVFSSPTTSEDTRALARIGASLHPGFWLPLESRAKMLGIPFQRTQGIYHAFADPPELGSLLDPREWRIATLDGREMGTSLHDGFLHTGFNTLGNNPDGQGFTVDFGQEVTIAGFVLIPQDYQEVPAGLQIETAVSDRRFEAVRTVRNYIGPFYLSGPRPFFAVRYPRIECRFPPRSARYLRLTQLGRIRKDWPVREILVYGVESQSGKTAWPEAGRQLLEVVRDHPLKKLYADAWPASVIYSSPRQRKPRVLLPQLHVDPYGSMDPSPLEPLVLDPSPGNGLLIYNREVPWTTERLHRSGIAFQAVPAGNYTLFILKGRQGNRPLRPLQILSDQNPVQARELLRGLPPGRRWSTGTPQRPGLSLTVDLGKVQRIQSLALGCPGYPRDFPRGLEAAVSADGLRWEKTGLHLSEPLVFTGQILLGWQGPTQRYRLDPAVEARFLRLILSESDPVYWWSVESLQIFGPE